MLLNKDLAVCGIVVCISILQSSCAPSTLKDDRMHAEVAASNDHLPSCGDPLIYYCGLAARTNEEISAVDTTTLSGEHATDACPKLRKAIFLSLPGNNQQNDQDALELLKDLKRTGMLSGSDLRFSSMLLQHVSQRQDLREHITAQEKRLVEVETQNTVLRNQLTTLQSQLDQLKNIEVEIDKKERSLTSPTNE